MKISFLSVINFFGSVITGSGYESYSESMSHSMTYGSWVGLMGWGTISISQLVESTYESRQGLMSYGKKIWSLWFLISTSNFRTLTDIPWPVAWSRATESNFSYFMTFDLLLKTDHLTIRTNWPQLMVWVVSTKTWLVVGLLTTNQPKIYGLIVWLVQWVVLR